MVWPHDQADAPAKLAYAEARRPYKKSQGGQRINWITTIRKDFKQLKLELTDAEKLAHDKDTYSQLIGSAMAQTHTPSLRKRSELGSQKSGRTREDDDDDENTLVCLVIKGMHYAHIT